MDNNASVNNFNFVGTNGYTLTVSSAKTLTVNSTLNLAAASCSVYNSIVSSSTTTQANISMASGSHVLNYYLLNDMNFTGGATWSAPTAMGDDGNNSGISITLATASSISYYWIGGSGNWSDPTHWALSSGGAGQAATGCVPDSNDDVYFDDNSFSSGGQTVTIDVNAQCRNMDWTNAANSPSLARSNQIELHGSLTLISDMNVTGYGKVYFKGTSAGNTITMAGHSFYEVYIEATTGEYILQDEFACTYFFRFNS
jgi:hypothetical protein